MVGYGGLGILDTGSSGAVVAGGFLEGSEFGIVEGFRSGAQAYSIGVPLAADAGLRKADEERGVWMGAMVGFASWDVTDRYVPGPDGTGVIQAVPGGEASGFVSGTASLNVIFEQVGPVVQTGGTLP